MNIPHSPALPSPDPHLRSWSDLRTPSHLPRNTAPSSSSSQTVTPLLLSLPPYPPQWSTCFGAEGSTNSNKIIRLMALEAHVPYVAFCSVMDPTRRNKSSTLLDGVGFDNEPAHHWVCFSSTPLRSKGCGRGSWELFSVLPHPPPSSSCYYLMPTGSRRTCLTELAFGITILS